MNNKSIFSNFLLLALIFIATSCYVVEDLILPYAGDKLVVNGFLTSNGVSVSVSRSQQPSGLLTEEKGISNAKVILFKAKKPILELNEVEIGVYQSSYIPEISEDFHIEVTADGYPPVVSAVERMPSAFPLVEINYTEKEVVLQNSRPGIQLAISFLDEGGSPDFYEFFVLGYHSDTDFVLVNMGVRGDTGFTNVPCVLSSSGSGVMLKDSCFDGQAHTIHLEFENSGIFDTEDGIQDLEFEKFIISMRKVSESYVRYRETSIIPWRLQYAFFEPRILFNNIRGGYGIFGSWNESQLEIEIK